MLKESWCPLFAAVKLNVTVIVAGAVTVFPVQSMVQSRMTPSHLAVLDSPLSRPSLCSYTSTQSIVHYPTAADWGYRYIVLAEVVRQTLE